MIFYLSFFTHCDGYCFTGNPTFASYRWFTAPCENKTQLLFPRSIMCNTKFTQQYVHQIASTLVDMYRELLWIRLNTELPLAVSLRAILFDLRHWRIRKRAKQELDQLEFKLIPYGFVAELLSSDAQLKHMLSPNMIQCIELHLAKLFTPPYTTKRACLCID